MIRRAILLILLGAGIGADLPPVPFVSTNQPWAQCAWSPNPDPAVIGYKLYGGVGSRSYTNAVDCGLATNGTITITSRQVANYFALTDYDTNGIESDYSNEAVLAPAPIVPVYGLLFNQGTSDGTNWVDLTPQPFLRLTNAQGGALQWQWFRSRTEVTTNWR